MKYPKLRREVSNEKLIDRGLKIVAQDQNKIVIKYNQDSDQEEHLQSYKQNEGLNEKIRQFQKQNKHQILVKKMAGLDKMQSVMDKLKTKELFKKMEDHSDRLAALYFNLQRKHKTTYLDKLDKQIILKRWIDAKSFNQISEKQNLKAFKFHQLNQKIKLKILIQRSRKILKKEKQTYKLIH